MSYVLLLSIGYECYQAYSGPERRSHEVNKSRLERDTMNKVDDDEVLVLFHAH